MEEKDRAHCEPSEREEWRHTWARGTADGWSICTRCGAAAICPECLPEMPEGALIWRCPPHRYQGTMREQYER